MIFQHTWQQVLDGRKLQTRRIVKPGDDFLLNWSEEVQSWADGKQEGLYVELPAHVALRNISRVVDVNDRTRWAVGNTYAVQPGRGQKAVGRIRITGIRREDVRNISAEDVKAEGYTDRDDFFFTWCLMHDKSYGQGCADMLDVANACGGGTGYIYSLINDRPAHLYDAWVLEFELVESEV